MKKHLNIFMLVISLALFSLPAIAMEPSDTPEQQLQKTVKQAADKQGSQGFWNKLDKSPRMFETMRRVVQQYLNPQGNNPLVSTFAKKLIKITTLTLSGHTGIITSVAFSPDGTKLASGSYDRTIKIWDLVNLNNQPQTLSGHTGTVRSVAFSPDGKKLASGSRDKTIKIWDLVNPNNQPQTLPGHADWVNSVAFSPDGKLASGAWDIIKIWDLNNPNDQPRVLSGHTLPVNSVSFNNNGTQLASGSFDRTIKVWDLVNPNNQPQTLSDTHAVTSVAFSPDGTKLASGSVDKTIKRWDLVNPNNQPETLPGHADWVNSVAFSPDGKLASGADDRTIKIWNIPLPEFIKSLYADEKGLKKFLLLRAILESKATTDGNGEAKQSKPLDLYNPAAIAVLKDLPIWLQKALQDKNMVRVFKKVSKKRPREEEPNNLSKKWKG